MTNLFRLGKRKRLFAGEIAATLGNFDGIHIGHQALLNRVRTVAAERAYKGSSLITFSPHPAIVLGKASEIPSITTLRQKLSLLDAIGISELVVVSFTKKLSEMSWENFVSEILIGELNIGYLVLGPDARIGKGGAGTADMILGELRKNGRDGEVLPFLTRDGVRASSNEVRRRIGEGNPRGAADLLGREFALDGSVVAGDGRGKTIGVPTINLHTFGQVLPKDGVYATRVVVDGRLWKGATNIGIRPTFSGTARKVETHIVDYKGGSLYGKRVELRFVDKIRDELKFPTVEELRAQIARDIQTVSKMLKEK